MNKKKEEKKEKTLKILKIVGSALGLTLCAGAFVSLLVLGVRGCAHQSNIQVNQTTERVQKRLSNRQLNNVVVGAEYVNTQLVSGTNSGKLFHAYSNSDDMRRQFPYKADVTYNGQTYHISNAFVSSEFEMDVTFELLDVNGQAIIYGTAWDTGEDSLEWDNFDSEVWDFVPVTNLIGNLTIKQLLDYENNEAVNLLNAFYEDYFTPQSELLNTTINFNSVINPYGPWGVNFDYFININITGSKTLFNGLFKDSEGNFYNRIVMHYINQATGTRFGTATSYNTYQGNGSHYMTMSYIRVTGQDVTVNAQDYAIPTGGDQAGNGVTVMLKSNHWTSSIFQSITILTAENDADIGTTFTPIARLSGLNNVYSDYTGVTESTGVMGNVFALLKGAFSSWLPILNIQVLPGIALGVFVFLPLVVMIVLFIVWLFKR